MRSAVSTYAEEISSKLKYLAAWPVIIPLRLGTIGTLDDSLFDPIGDVASFGVGGMVDDGLAEADISYSSNEVDAGSVNFGAAIPNLPAAGGVGGSLGVKFSFSRDHSVALRMTGVKSKRISDQISLAKRIAALASAGSWNPEWFIVTEVLTATSTSVLISAAGQSSVEFSISAKAPVGGLDLLDASLKPTLTGQSSMDTVILNANGASPLFRAKRIKQTFWNGIQAVLVAGAAGAAAVPSDIAPADLFDDFDSADNFA